MNKRFFFTYVIVTFTLFCVSTFATTLTISKEKEFILEVMQDKRITKLNLSYNDTDSSKIEKTFKKLTDFFSKTDIAKGGQYSIYPNYSYTNNKQEFIDYSGQISYNIEFDNNEKYEEILDFVKSFNHIKITQSPISNTLSDERKSLHKQILEEKALQYIITNAVDISKSINMECQIKTINLLFENHNFQPIMMQKSFYGNYESADSVVSSPLETSVLIKLNSSFSLECQKGK